MTMSCALKGCGVLVSFLFLSKPMTEKPWYEVESGSLKL
jgi:hypothetical protein